MILKHFILTSGVIIILFVIQKLHYNFGNHNWSLNGYKSYSNIYILYYAFSRLYLIIWSIYITIKFLKWYYEKV